MREPWHGSPTFRKWSCIIGVMTTSPPDGAWHGPVGPPLVSRRYGIPESTLAHWRSRRYGPPFFKIGKHVRYLAEECDAWFAAQRVGAGNVA